MYVLEECDACLRCCNVNSFMNVIILERFSFLNQKADSYMHGIIGLEFYIKYQFNYNKKTPSS